MMPDAIFTVLTVVLFALMFLYVSACERLR